MHRHARFGLSLTAAVLAGPVAAADIPYSDLYVFGDSTSDVGRVYTVTGGLAPVSPPYYRGQFTGPEGPVWAEIVGDAFEAEGKEVRNYAFGAGDALGLGFDDLAGQVGTFALDLATSRATPGADTIATFWFGGNDLFSTIGSGTAQTTAVLAADAIAAGAAALDALAGIDSFLFFTLPDLSKIPRYLAAADDVAREAREAAAAFNGRLLAQVTNLRSLGYDATLLDVGGLIDRAGSFGFANTTVPCVLPINDFTAVAQDCTLVPGLDVSQFLWFDPVHPSSRAHAVVADAVLAEIAPPPSPVPLPATFPLAAAGLVLLVGVARRRA